MTNHSPDRRQLLHGAADAAGNTGNTAPAVLHTARLVLRPPVIDDFHRFLEIHADPAANRFNPAGPLADREQARQRLDAWIRHWDEHGYGQWAVAAIEAPGHVIGFGGIALRDYLGVQRANLGYRFDAAAWGRGHATELGRAALDAAFHAWRLPEVFGLVRPAHAVSIRVLEKIGMRRIATLDDVPGAAPSLVYQAVTAA